MTDRRVLEHADARVVLAAGAILIAAVAVSIVWPRVFAIPFAALVVWLGVALLLRAYRLYRYRTPSGATASDPMDAERDQHDETGTGDSHGETQESLPQYPIERE